MSSEAIIVTKLHNAPPVALPSEQEMLTDLQTRYPEIDKRLTEWDGAFAGFLENGKPVEIPLEHEDVAANLQDLLGQVKKDSKVWTDSFQKQEKKPLNALVKVVGNFFTSRIEKADKHLEKFGPVHSDFMQRKAEASRKAAEAEAERQRAIEVQARADAEKARRDEEAARARAEEERQKEAAAREAAEKAKKEKEEAEARAALALAEEKRLADEKKSRDREEKDQNINSLREIRGHMKRVESLHTLAEADEATDEELADLDKLVRAGGIIGNLASPVANSMLLDEDQKTSINATRTRLGELRIALNERVGKREQKKRQKEADEAAAAEEKLNAERQKRRAEEDAALAAAKKNREAEEAAAAAASEERKRLDLEARTARDTARDHEGEAKASGKVAKGHASDADRTANRADRLEMKLENSTDADHSRTRGELGTLGSITRRWSYHIVDEATLRAGFLIPKHPAPSAGLAEHLTTDALEGAVFRWMRAHQASFTGERVEGLLPGVVFAYEQEARIA